MIAVVAALVVGAVVAGLLAGRAVDDAPSEAVFGTAPASATSTVEAMATAIAAETAVAAEPREPELFVGQVIGLRGCDQPIFVTAGGVTPGTRVRVERANDGQAIEFRMSDAGFVALDGRPLFAHDCVPGMQYALRLVEESSGRQLATSGFEVPVFPGTIEVEPTSGGCTEIMMTVRGMPAGYEVNVLMAEPIPFADNFPAIVLPFSRADSEGFARSESFRPPWSCDTVAVSLFVVAGARGQPQPTQAELLYRIALKPDEPVPSVERWLDSMGR